MPTTPSNTAPNTLSSRGLARAAARGGIPLGRAYREDCRVHPQIVGSYVEYADAYEDERKAVVS